MDSQVADHEADKVRSLSKRTYSDLLNTSASLHSVLALNL